MLGLSNCDFCKFSCLFLFIFIYLFLLLHFHTLVDKMLSKESVLTLFHSPSVPA